MDVAVSKDTKMSTLTTQIFYVFFKNIYTSLSISGHIGYKRDIY